MFQRPKLRRQLNTHYWKTIAQVEEEKGPDAAYQQYCKFIKNTDATTLNDFMEDFDCYKAIARLNTQKQRPAN